MEIVNSKRLFIRDTYDQYVSAHRRHRMKKRKQLVRHIFGIIYSDQQCETSERTKCSNEYSQLKCEQKNMCMIEQGNNNDREGIFEAQALGSRNENDITHFMNHRKLHHEWPSRDNGAKTLNARGHLFQFGVIARDIHTLYAPDRFSISLIYQTQFAISSDCENQRPKACICIANIITCWQIDENWLATHRHIKHR